METDFKKKLVETKLRLLDMHYKAKCGHLGGNFSCIDALMVLHHSIMMPEDHFILSKGHSAGALYATLWSLGKITDSDLETFSKDNSFFPGHPSGKGIPDLLFSTGSLGHGPSLAAGLAVAAKHKKSNRHIYCLCSDGEWQEGSCWEALTFSIHRKLNNLTYIIDQNGLQGFGTTEDVISCRSLLARITGFGANVVEVDGHSCKIIKSALKSKSKDNVNIVILNTTKGKLLHYEGELESHYLPLTDDQYHAAINNIRRDQIL